MIRRLAAFSVLFTTAALAQPGYVERLNEVPDAQRLRDWHDLLASEPHIAGTEGDARVIETLAKSFGDMGYEVEVHEFWPYLSYPVSAEVEVLHPSIGPGAGMLPLQEVPLQQDRFSQDPGLTIGFNAFSGSGEAVGEVVYANFGRKQDFERLAEMGVDCTGKIVLARYGGNYRGYKVKFAEEAGAAGLLIYLDPGDTGYVRGETYPEGGWQTDACIQRGSIMTLPYKGDPLTPFVEATEDAERLDPDEVALPRIPVQPIGWGAARQIIVRMDGSEAPEQWRGGLPMSYPLTGGNDLRVRVNVQQERRIAKTANVIARMEGATYPDQWVIVGCHHDAWGFGACDAMSGMISLMESARSVAQLAESGWKPERTVIFAAWGAEEFGIIGSSEWVEANAEELREKAVAYINLDMASMGPEFRASASPSLRRLIEEAARDVPQARAPEMSVYDEWVGRAARSDDPARPRIGDLGGGSDHVGFVCHLGIPGMALSGGGSPGSAYHTAYDNLAWYRQVVGEDYEPALMITRMTNGIVGRLASEHIVPYDMGANAGYIATNIDADILRQAEALVKTGLDGDDWHRVVHEELPMLVEQAAEVRELWRAYESAIEEAARKEPQLVRALGPLFTKAFMRAERNWANRGSGSTEWYRNRGVSPDPDSGYSSMTLPDLRRALQRRDWHDTMNATGALSFFVLEHLADELRRQIEILRERAGES